MSEGRCVAVLSWLGTERCREHGCMFIPSSRFLDCKAVPKMATGSS